GVDIGVGAAAGEFGVAGAPVEEGDGAAFGAQPGAQGRRRLLVHGAAGEDHAVVPAGAFDGDLAVADVVGHPGRVAVQRVAPAAAPRRADADGLARLDRLVVDQALHLLAVDVDAEGASRAAAVDAPARQDGA